MPRNAYASDLADADLYGFRIVEGQA